MKKERIKPSLYKNKRIYTCLCVCPSQEKSPLEKKFTFPINLFSLLYKYTNLGKWTEYRTPTRFTKSLHCLFNVEYEGNNVQPVFIKEQKYCVLNL